MDIKKSLIGVTLATTVAVTFAVIPLNSAIAHGAKVSCYGVNSCKGTSACKTSAHACKGQNACKGQGIATMSKQECLNKNGSLKEPTQPEKAPGSTTGFSGGSMNTGGNGANISTDGVGSSQ